jgi:hypothetical protein
MKPSIDFGYELLQFESLWIFEKINARQLL